ncbi:hypothetical protein [Bdellovibrio bacteriovorus]|uniref:hypothetical protein n=1 Tax=Bdellovibrio bacteriovorus TaxID=959 RepID=UPI0035A86FF2
MLKKFLLGLGALFFILVGSLILIMGYVFNNPDSVFNAFNSVTDKILQGQKYEENEEFFLQGMNRLTLSARRVDLSLKVHAGNTLKVHMHGKVPRFEQGPFVLQTAEKDAVHIQFQEPIASSWIQMNVNGQELTKESDSKLKADVYLPESFKGQVTIETRDGNVHLQIPEDLLYELELQSVSGKIQNNLKTKPVAEILPQEVGHIKVQTTEGSISVNIPSED